tara:strand:- start:64 stop:213 length:150 start_codon:yes stop_codon:yes gene_type:complete
MLAILLNMIKLAIIKAMSVMSIAVLLLIIGLSPLYVTMSFMTRQMEKVD